MYLSSVEVYRPWYGVGDLGKISLSKKKKKSAPAPAIPPSLKSNVDFFNSAINDIPWPHTFFKSFVVLGSPDSKPFHNGIKIEKVIELAGSDLFPISKSELNRRIAFWLYENQDGMNRYFENAVKILVHHKEKQAKKKAKRKKRIGVVITILGAVISIITGGILAPAIIALLQAGYSIYEAKKGSKESLSNAKKLMKFLGISPEAMEKFRLWIVSNAERDPEAPPVPEGQEIRAKYLFFVEETLPVQSDNMEDGMKSAFKASKTGDRVTVVDASVGKVSVMMLREEKGFRKIPFDKGASVQALPKASAERLAGKSGFPIWLLAVPALAFAVKG